MFIYFIINNIVNILLQYITGCYWVTDQQKIFVNKRKMNATVMIQLRMNHGSREVVYL